MREAGIKPTSRLGAIKVMASLAGKRSPSTRRSFIQFALAAGGAYAVGGRAETIPHPATQSTEGVAQDQEQPREPTPIIDTHIHLVRGNPYLEPLGPYGKRVTGSPEEEKPNG
jgi:hypothetical protein